MRRRARRLRRTAAMPPFRTVVPPSSTCSEDETLVRGEKDACSDTQKRKARHIEQSELEAGRSRKDAERIAWATVNKQDGGGLKDEDESAKGGSWASKTASDG